VEEEGDIRERRREEDEERGTGWGRPTPTSG